MQTRILFVVAPAQQAAAARAPDQLPRRGYTTGGEMVLAENIDSHSKAKLVESYFREQLGLNKTPGFIVE